MNILIIKLSAIGDVIHALAVPGYIKKSIKNAHITWAVEAAAAPLVKACADVDDVIIVPKKEIRSFNGFVKNIGPMKRDIRRYKYDYSLDLQGLLKSALVAKLARAKVKLGTANMREFSGMISKSVKGEHKNGHIVERYLDVARFMGANGKVCGFKLNLKKETEEKVKEMLTINPEDKYAALVIGGNWPNKRWNGANWAYLSNALYNKGITPILLGAGKIDEDTGKIIMNETSRKPIDLIGRTDLLEAAAILKNADIAIGGDTGLMHMAAGMGVKCAMLMGPTNKERNGPFMQEENAIEVNRECKGCWKRKCPKNLNCLSNISVESVLNKVNEIYNG